MTDSPELPDSTVHLPSQAWNPVSTMAASATTTIDLVCRCATPGGHREAEHEEADDDAPPAVDGLDPGLVVADLQG